MLKFVYGSPTGSVKWEHSYAVPLDDLFDNEKKSLDCSQQNWSMHHQRFLEAHPKIKEELKRI